MLHNDLAFVNCSNWFRAVGCCRDKNMNTDFPIAGWVLHTSTMCMLKILTCRWTLYVRRLLIRILLTIESSILLCCRNTFNVSGDTTSDNKSVKEIRRKKHSSVINFYNTEELEAHVHNIVKNTNWFCTYRHPAKRSCDRKECKYTVFRLERRI